MEVRAGSRSAAWLCLALLLLVVPTVEPSAAAESGLEISVLTYNIHGLPSWAAGDDPEGRLPRILELAAAYDVVLLQEDFAYNGLVKQHARQPLLERGVGPWRPWPGLTGSGLTLLADAGASVLRHAAAYDLCNGWLGAGSDCFANKGFLMLRLRQSSGAEVDVWNTHLDAGGSFGDYEARRAQLARLQREIRIRSRGRAVIVGGDFNTDLEIERERGLIEGFASALGLTIGAVPAGAWPERIDYILHRSGDHVSLNALEVGLAPEFVLPDGKPLSDHPALRARFRLD